MKKLEYSIDIDATPQQVWEKMLTQETYKQWTGVAWPGSYFEGTWKLGESLRFISPSGGGTKARITEFKPYEHILALHEAVILKDNSEDRDSEMAKGWVGTTEAYTFTKTNNGTRLLVEINTNPAWEKMFDEGWGKALAKLKEIAEA